MAKTKKNKKLSTLLVVLLLAAVAVGGMLAYLQSEDSDVNVMTLGNVKIEQIEQQRVEKDGEFTSELEAFEQGKVLMPYTNREDTPDTIMIGDKKVTLSDKYNNYVDKIISVTNTGESDAYVRTLVAVPTGGADWEPTAVSATNCWLHWNYPGASFTDENWGSEWNSVYVEIDGKGYYVWEFVHKTAVESGETTYPVLHGFFMDYRVGNDDDGLFMDYGNGIVKRIDDFGFEEAVNILVLSQAVQTAGFADAQTALDTAFGDVTKASAEAWFCGMEAPTAVATADELAAAIKAGVDMYLTADVSVDADATMTVATGKDVTLNLNGHTLSGTADGTGNREMFLVKGNMTVENGKIEMVAENNQGWGAMATIFDVTAGGVLNIANAVIKNDGGTDMNFGIHLNNWGEVTLNIENSTISASYIAVRVFNSGNDMNNVTIKNSKLEGKYSFWVHNYTVADFGTQEKADAHAKLLNFDIFNGTNEFVYTGAAPVLYGFTNAIYFDANGNVQ